MPTVKVAVSFALLMAFSSHAAAKDELLETLAQKGILSAEEYAKLKEQRKTEVMLNTEDGFKVSSNDGAWSAQIGTLQQLDYADYKEDQAKLSDGSELRRSRLSLGGTFLKDWQYRVEYEFAGTTGVTDAYVAYTALKPVTVTLGQFKQPFGMEAVAADKGVTFMERGLPFAFITTRAPGVMVGTSGGKWSVNAGLFGEPVGAAQAGDEGHGIAARGTWAPLLDGNRVLHLGLAANLRQPTDDNSTNAGTKFTTVRFRSKPESNVLAQRFVDTGELRDVDDYAFYGFELAAALGAASLQAELHQASVKRAAGDDLDFSGWYAQLAYTLTGEARPYKSDKGVFDGIRPARPFGKEGWGAFEIALRFSGLDLTDADITGGEERNATAALSWYLNPLLRFSLNAVKVLEVDGGLFDEEEPTAYQLRLQLAI